MSRDAITDTERAFMTAVGNGSNVGNKVTQSVIDYCIDEVYVRQPDTEVSLFILTNRGHFVLSMDTSLDN